MADPAVLKQLRETLSGLETGGFRRRPALPFGIEAIDSRLADGGLRLDALHEVAAGTRDMADDCAATCSLPDRGARLGPGALEWCGERDLFAPGLAQSGLDHKRLIYAEARDDAELLGIMEGLAPSRPGRGDRRSQAGGHDRDAPAPARGRGRTDDRTAAEARRTRRRRPDRHAFGGSDPLARDLRAFGTAAGGRRRAAALAAGAGAAKRGRGFRDDSGGMPMQRVAALFLPLWPIEKAAAGGTARRRAA